MCEFYRSKLGNFVFLLTLGSFWWVWPSSALRSFITGGEKKRKIVSLWHSFKIPLPERRPRTWLKPDTSRNDVSIGSGDSRFYDPPMAAYMIHPSFILDARRKKIRGDSEDNGFETTLGAFLDDALLYYCLNIDIFRLCLMLASILQHVKPRSCSCWKSVI